MYVIPFLVLFLVINPQIFVHILPLVLFVFL